MNERTDRAARLNYDKGGLMVTIHLSASEALYEEDGPLYGSDQPDSIELGPYDFVQFT